MAEFLINIKKLKIVEIKLIYIKFRFEYKTCIKRYYSK